MPNNSSGVYTFYANFSSSIPLYRGVNAVWIGDGSPVDIDHKTGGTAGALYASYVTDEYQELGYVSDYYQAKEYFETLGITLTYEQWVELLCNTPKNAEDSEAWAAGTVDGTSIPSTHPAYHNNSKYWEELAKLWANYGTDGNTPTASNNAKEYARQSGVSATNSATSANNSATSESNAASSASAAAQSESNAATSASNAAQSEANAAASKGAAATSESNAATSETNAANSATAAATSESNAASSASAAALSETNAATSESNAAQSESSAQAAKTAAEAAQSKAEIAITHYPRINNNSNWEVWDVVNEEWDDTGYKSMAEATISSAYQNSTSGTVVPTGTWTPTPQPESGRFMWIRTTYTWTNGHTDNFYNVSYIGANGSGSVDSVNGLGGNVILDSTNIYINESASQKETIFNAFARLGTAITDAEIDALFDVDQS